jgi:hypothetical protein
VVIVGRRDIEPRIVEARLLSRGIQVMEMEIGRCKMGEDAGSVVREGMVLRRVRRRYEMARQGTERAMQR